MHGFGKRFVARTGVSTFYNRFLTQFLTVVRDLLNPTSSSTKPFFPYCLTESFFLENEKHVNSLIVQPSFFGTSVVRGLREKNISNVKNQTPFTLEFVVGSQNCARKLNVF